MKAVSKSEFKPRAFEYLREAEARGEPLQITDHGRPAVVVSPADPFSTDAAGSLEGTIQSYSDPTAPIADDDWDAAK